MLAEIFSAEGGSDGAGEQGIDHPQHRSIRSHHLAGGAGEADVRSKYSRRANREQRTRTRNPARLNCRRTAHPRRRAPGDGVPIQAGHQQMPSTLAGGLPRNCRGGQSTPDCLEPMFVDTESGRAGCRHSFTVAGVVSTTRMLPASPRLDRQGPDWFLCRVAHNQSSCAAGSRRLLPSFARCSW